jgi:hypothetical protein
MMSAAPKLKPSIGLADDRTAALSLKAGFIALYWSANKAK